MSQFFETREETESWLKKVGIEGYTISDDLTVDVQGSVDISRRGVGFFPVRFGRVGGLFNCDENQLTSLAGAPYSARGGFSCHGNQLTSLTDAPQSVDGGFYCSNNRLVSLVGAPSSVVNTFDCSYNELVSLVGAPALVGGNFYCNSNKLPSLVGVPSLVGGNFISDFQEKSLREHIKSLYATSGEFSAENLVGLCAEIRAEMDSRAMSAAIGEVAAEPVVARRKASRA